MIGVIYWTGSGSTEEMANIVAEGVKAAGKDVIVKRCEEISVQEAMECEAFAFGCPAMGDEVLEETAFEPWFAEMEAKLSGKKVGLFGSYGWGTGLWMENWEARTKDAGAEVIATVIAQGAADSDATDALKAMGETLAK